MSLTSPLSRVKEGVRLACRVTPKSSRNSVDGFFEDAAGLVALKARVTAAPEKGKANKALIKLLAKETRLAPSTMSVIAGAQSRNKMVLITGEPGALAASLQPWLNELNGKSP